MVIAGVDDPEIARWISIRNQCEIFHCLPGPGGLFDQDRQVMEVLTMVVSAEAEQQRLEAKANAPRQ